MSQAARQLALNPTKGYKPKTQSQIPGPFFAILLRGVETEAFTNLKEGPKALYMLMPYYVMWTSGDASWLELDYWRVNGHKAI